MNRNSPIIIIEDDLDDQEIFADAFKSLDYVNEVMFFIDGQKALDYLTNTDINPFAIISDINMPKLDGFALRDKIRMDAGLQVRCIPYLFFTTASNQNDVINAYSMNVQGYFIKQNSQKDLEKILNAIMVYWGFCVAPNNFPKLVSTKK
jgi:CheY-like chemotaxis protein